MTDNRNNHPLDPMEDQVLDQYLASLGRYAPSPAFDDRVMARVRINAPVPAPAPPAGGPAIFPPRAAPAAAGLIAVAVPSWQAVLAWITTTVPSVGSALV